MSTDIADNVLTIESEDIVNLELYQAIFKQVTELCKSNFPLPDHVTLENFAQSIFAEMLLENLRYSPAKIDKLARQIYYGTIHLDHEYANLHDDQEVEDTGETTSGLIHFFTHGIQIPPELIVSDLISFVSECETEELEIILTKVQYETYNRITSGWISDRMEQSIVEITQGNGYYRYVEIVDVLAKYMIYKNYYVTEFLRYNKSPLYTEALAPYFFMETLNNINGTYKGTFVYPGHPLISKYFATITLSKLESQDIPNQDRLLVILHFLHGFNYSSMAKVVEGNRVYVSARLRELVGSISNEMLLKSSDYMIDFLKMLPRDREVMVLNAYGHSPVEIADMIGLSRGNVVSIINKHLGTNAVSYSHVVTRVGAKIGEIATKFIDYSESNGQFYTRYEETMREIIIEGEQKKLNLLDVYFKAQELPSVELLANHYGYTLDYMKRLLVNVRRMLNPNEEIRAIVKNLDEWIDVLPTSKHHLLSQMQKEMAILIMQDPKINNKQIAKELGINRTTVTGHRNRIHQVLGDSVSDWIFYTEF